MTSPRGPLTVLLLLVALMSKEGAEASCSAAGRCCEGKDNGCRGVVVYSNSLRLENLLYGNVSKKSCFCDSACVRLGDCCSDYRDHCPPVDCILADDWQPWTACSSRCGLGTRRRSRRIVRAASNGGRPCPSTVQKGICYGTGCKFARAHGRVQMQETAKLLPASLGRWRTDKKYSPYKDIRKNLFQKYDNNVYSPDDTPTYCAMYSLTDVRPSCWVGAHPGGRKAWTANMTKGVDVCAECQPTAMRSKLGGRCQGQGLRNRETQWMAFGVPGCHGAWVMKTRQERCRCSGRHLVNLILV